MKSPVGMSRVGRDKRPVIAAAKLAFLVGAIGCSDSPETSGAQRVAERITGGQRLTTTNQVGAIGYAEAPAGAEADPDDPDLVATFQGSGVLQDSDVVLTAAHVAATTNDENLVFLESDGQIVDAAWMRNKLLHPTFFPRAELETMGLPRDADGRLKVSLHQIGIDLAIVFLKTPITPPPGVVLPRAIQSSPAQLVGQSGSLSMYSYMLNTDEGLLNRGQMTPQRANRITSLPLGRDHQVGSQFVSTSFGIRRKDSSTTGLRFI